MAAHIWNMRVCFACQRILRSSSQRLPNHGITRHASDLVMNHRWQLDPKLDEYLDSGQGKARTHPGLMTCKKKVRIPAKLQESISVLVEKYPTKDLEKKSKALAQQLWSRHRPCEQEEIQERSQHMKARVLAAENKDPETMTEDELHMFESKVKGKVLRNLRREIYHWQPIQYGAYKAFLYLVGRLAQDYASLVQIFSEIATRDPTFSPSTVFDYGSGVGSTIWAASEIWKDSIKEFFCVDASSDMNTLARLLLQGGHEDADMVIPQVYFRQFLPPSQTRTYSMVVSAFSLLELPTQADRLQLLFSLWQRTSDYLVIIENGTNAGFQTVLEARNFVLQLSHNKNFPKSEQDEQIGHVFSPCPHDDSCPRFTRMDGTPCNFQVHFEPLRVSGNTENKKAEIKYSYVVLRRGPRREGVVWPRIVREVSTQSKRAQIRMCCPDGQLQQAIFTKAKHGRKLYACARACRWGDLLPALPRVDEDSKQPELSSDESYQNDAQEDEDKPDDVSCTEAQS